MYMELEIIFWIVLEKNVLYNDISYKELGLYFHFIICFRCIIQHVFCLNSEDATC